MRMDIVESVSIDETALPSPWVAGANTNLRILASKVMAGLQRQRLANFW